MGGTLLVNHARIVRNIQMNKHALASITASTNSWMSRSNTGARARVQAIMIATIRHARIKVLNSLIPAPT